ncbi:hypothetical protein BOX15_Mlig026756g1, partial [Macrostomum lignano]
NPVLQKFYPSANKTMKASSERDATIVFNLGLAPTLTCARGSDGESQYCSVCDACRLRYTVEHVKEWLSRAGDLSRRRFVVGLVRRAHSRDLLRHLGSLLAPCVANKDSTYARSRVKPALPTDRLTASNNHALPPSGWELVQAEVYEWFLSSSYWVKVNFLMQMLSVSDAHTVRAALNYLRNAEPLEDQIITGKFGDEFESGSQHDTDYNGSYRSEDDPNVELLRSASRAYSSIPDDFSFEDRASPPPTIAESSDGDGESGGEQVSLSVGPPTTVPMPPIPSPAVLLQQQQQQQQSQEPVAEGKVADDVTAAAHPTQSSAVESVKVAVAAAATDADADSLRTEAAVEAAVSAVTAAEEAAAVKAAAGAAKPPPRPSKSAPPRRIQDRQQKLQPQQQQKQQQQQQQQDSQSKTRPFTAEAVLNSIVLTAAGDTAFSGASGHVDFIRQLPVHLSKYIVNLLDDKSAKQAAAVSTYWSNVVDEVSKESGMNLQIKEEVMLLQGTLANTVNPRYASDLDVPVPNQERGSHKVRLTGEPLTDQRDPNGHLFKNECNFEAGYRGVSTRNVIMEERNVYCGPYNVLVLFSEEDPQRVTHYSGGNLLAYSDNNRRIHFADVRTGATPAAGTQPLRGHAGPVRCLLLCEARGFLLSGSYDTSLRRWDIATGKCAKIYRGHMGTVLAVDIYLNTIVSGSADGSAKVWNLEDWKAVRTLKHKSAVSAVAINENTAVTGDAKGKVKVWDLVNGSLVKKLIGHSAEVTAIKCDHWHILTCSKDSYALLWSAIGNHAQCLGAHRHPKPILCAEFQFMRAITASEDGRVRIWNVVSRNCCRIMRGNSRSDPILNISAVGQKILVNTKTNVLALTFESVNWDYSLETDSMPPLIRYSSYRDAPVRWQPHGYIRAQRLQLAGAADSRIVWRHETRGRGVGETDMTDGSAAPAGMRQLSLSLASRGGVGKSPTAPGSAAPPSGLFESRVPQPKHHRQCRTASGRRSQMGEAVAGNENQQPTTPGKPTTAGKPTRSLVDQGVGERRLSWAFEHPPRPVTKDPGLAEMKRRLRAQLRAPGADPPDFVRQLRRALHAAGERPRTESDRELRRQMAVAAVVATEPEDQQPPQSPPPPPPPPLRKPTKVGSAPTAIDPRAKIVGEQAVQLERRRVLGELPEGGDDDIGEGIAEAAIQDDDDSARELAARRAAQREIRSASTVGFARVAGGVDKRRPGTAAATTTTPTASRHSAKLRSHIPKPELVRPLSAVSARRQTSARVATSSSSRPATATASAGMTRSPMLAAASNDAQWRELKNLLAIRRAALAQQRRELGGEGAAAAAAAESPMLDPFRQRGGLVLRTLSETAAYVASIEAEFGQRQAEAEARDERQRRQRWLRYARSVSIGDSAAASKLMLARPKSAATGLT